jgi:hypothetical protein
LEQFYFGNKVIRDWKPEDTPEIERLHAEMGFDYRMPDLSDPLFIVKKVVEKDKKVVQSLCAKIELEVYLFIDRQAFGTPLEAWNRLTELVSAAKQQAFEKGVDDAFCVLPPEIADEFGIRLEKLGMIRTRPWPRFSLDLTVGDDCSPALSESPNGSC